MALGDVLLVTVWAFNVLHHLLEGGPVSESFRMLLTFLWQQDQYDYAAVTI